MLLAGITLGLAGRFVTAAAALAATAAAQDVLYGLFDLFVRISFVADIAGECEVAAQGIRATAGTAGAAAAAAVGTKNVAPGGNVQRHGGIEQVEGEDSFIHQGDAQGVALDDGHQIKGTGHFIDGFAQADFFQLHVGAGFECQYRWLDDEVEPGLIGDGRQHLIDGSVDQADADGACFQRISHRGDDG